MTRKRANEQQHVKESGGEGDPSFTVSSRILCSGVGFEIKHCRSQTTTDLCETPVLRKRAAWKCTEWSTSAIEGGVRRESYWSCNAPGVVIVRLIEVACSVASTMQRCNGEWS